MMRVLAMAPQCAVMATAVIAVAARAREKTTGGIASWTSNSRLILVHPLLGAAKRISGGGLLYRARHRGVRRPQVRSYATRRQKPCPRTQAHDPAQPLRRTPNNLRHAYTCRAVCSTSATNKPKRTGDQIHHAYTLVSVAGEMDAASPSLRQLMAVVLPRRISCGCPDSPKSVGVTSPSTPSCFGPIH